jgi:hypothetical protein
MPRSPPRSSTPPKGGEKRSRSSSPPKGGRRKSMKSAPKNASAAIQAFFRGKMGIFMLLQFLLGTEISFNLIAYHASPMHLPEGQLTAELVARWLLTLMLRKPAPGEQRINDQVWHHVLKFLHENSHLDEIKLCFHFMKHYETQIIQREIVPFWVQLVLAPFCGFTPSLLSAAIANSPCRLPELWSNALLTFTPNFFHFWFTNQTPYVWQYLLYHLLSHESFSEDVKNLVMAFFQDKPLESMMQIPVDLLILLNHHKVVTDSLLNKFLFSPKRRHIHKNRYFLDEYDIHPIVFVFLKKAFPSIYAYKLKNDATFTRVFLTPHNFFSTLLQSSKSFLESKILVNEMAKYLHMFCWDPTIFLPDFQNQGKIVKQILMLPDGWKYLFIQLWRCENSIFMHYHIDRFIKTVNSLENCFFNRNIVSMIRVFMTELVSNASPEDKLFFFKWLLEQETHVQAYFQHLTPELVNYCLATFPGTQTKRRLFWWLYTLQAALVKSSERIFDVDMGQLCQIMNLDVTEEELDFDAVNGFSPAFFVSQIFGIITLKFRFGSFLRQINFTRISHCDKFVLETNSCMFRVLVIEIKRAFFCHLDRQPNQQQNLNLLKELVVMCQQHSDLLKSLCQEDQAFLKALFQDCLPKLRLNEELVKTLFKFAMLMPDNVRQIMFTSCVSLKIFYEETLGSKPSRDPTEATSYEALCSRCARYFPPQGFGLNGHGQAVCRRCSQSNGTPILTTFSGLPFGSL